MCADHDRSSFVDASAQHADLYSAIRKYIRPDSFAVRHEGHHKEEKVSPQNPQRLTDPSTTLSTLRKLYLKPQIEHFNPKMYRNQYET